MSKRSLKNKHGGGKAKLNKEISELRVEIDKLNKQLTQCLELKKKITERPFIKHANNWTRSVKRGTYKIPSFRL
jgi:hypothetical protein